MTIKESIERLNKLIWMMNQITDDQFDIRNYRNECGSIRCVIGWMEVYFPEIGLKVNLMKQLEIKKAISEFFRISLKTVTQVFYNIQERDAEHLWGDYYEVRDNQVTRQMVIREIEKIIQRKEGTLI